MKIFLAWAAAIAANHDKRLEALFLDFHQGPELSREEAVAKVRP